MNFAMAQRILGLMLMIFSLTMLPPIGVSLLYADGHWPPFAASAAIIVAAGLLLWLPARNTRRDLRLRRQRDQQMLGADVGVMHPPRLFTRVDHGPARLLGEPLEQGYARRRYPRAKRR